VSEQTIITFYKLTFQLIRPGL